jgi:hypothetical protein
MKRAGDFDQDSFKKLRLHRQVFHRPIITLSTQFSRETLLERNRSKIQYRNKHDYHSSSSSSTRQWRLYIQADPGTFQERRKQKCVRVKTVVAGALPEDMAASCFRVPFFTASESPDEPFHLYRATFLPSGKEDQRLERNGQEKVCTLVRVPFFVQNWKQTKMSPIFFSHFLFAFITNRDGNGWQPRCKPFNRSPWVE